MEKRNELENKFYYHILDTLLNDDKNYLFIKKIIESNELFVNARLNEHHIIFEILDKYIENLKLKLINQKIVHINHLFFYKLLKLFKSKNLDLSNYEEQYFIERINELKDYLNKKGYNDNLVIQKDLRELITIDSMIKKEYILDKDYQDKIFQNAIYRIKENSNIILNTINIEDTKYAFTIDLDKNYNIYLKVHILDTYFLTEEDNLFKKMKDSKEYLSKKVKKRLKFKENNLYPVITYEFKITENGLVNSPKISENVIKISKIIKHYDLKNYLEDNKLKKFIKYSKYLFKYYDLEMDKINNYWLEKNYDEIINNVLKNYFIENNLDGIYKNMIKFSDEDIYQLHCSICYYLSKISKKEALIIVNNLYNLDTSCFYSLTNLEDSKIEFDTRTYSGYLNNLILKLNLHNLKNTNRYNIVLEDLQSLENELNNEEYYIDYVNQKRLIRFKNK